MGDRDSNPQAEAGAERVANGAERMPLAPSRWEADPTPPPARPPMSDDSKPPVLRKIPVPRVVRIARILWIFSFVLAGAAVLIAFLSHQTLTAELTTTLGRLTPGYSEDEVATFVDVAYWSCIAGLGVVITSEAILLGFVLNRRGGARWLQLLALALHVVVVVIALAFLAIGDWGAIVALLLPSGLLLAVTGWVLCLVGPANRWFRLKDEGQAPALD
jgi:hypothetical protein